MAHKKGVGSSRNGRDSQSKRLGVKKFGGEAVIAGLNVGLGKDHTLFALTPGVVSFKKKFDGRSYVSILPAQD